jgi:hypothetical protein
MISENSALNNRNKFLIRNGKRQEFCTSPKYQQAREARNQKDFRKRKAVEKAQNESKNVEDFTSPSKFNTLHNNVLQS